MKLLVIIKFAFKNLWSHRLRSILTVAGVTIGIGAIIFLVSLGYGLEGLVTSQVANFSAFTVIDVPAANIKTIEINQQTIDKIKSFGHITEVAPVTNLAGRIRKTDQASTAETVVTAAGNDYWSLAQTAVDKGHLPDKADEIVINQSIANLIGENLDQSIGKTVNMDMIIPPELQTTPTGVIKIAENIPVQIVGTLKDDSSPLILVSLDLLTKNGAGNFSSLKVKIDDKQNVDIVRNQIENAGFSTEYVGDTVSQISQVFVLFRVILAGFGLIALIVAALGTFNTLTISLLERTREIGLCKALGMQNKDVYKMFLTESLIIGVTGGIVGLALGISIGQGINFLLGFLANRSGAEHVSIFVTPWFFSFGVAIFSIIVGFLTGWYPSRRAVKLNPLDALRYE